MALDSKKLVQRDNRNMKKLSEEETIRNRPAPTFGTNDTNGAFNGTKEIVNNALDEGREGFGSCMPVTVEDDPEGDIFTIEDFGRGLPMDFNEELQQYNWELALCTLYASGKYDSNQYSQSTGLNGLGLTAMQYASRFMDVWATYDGKTRYMHFEKGKPVGDMKILPPIIDGTGTKIRFQPDYEVFPTLRTTKIAPEKYVMYLRQQAMLLPNFEISFNHYLLNNEIKFKYTRGAADYIESLVDKLMLNNTVEFFDSETGVDPETPDLEPYTVDMKITFNFSRALDEDGNKLGGVTEIYHNASHMFEGGTTVEGFQIGITKAFTDYAKSCGKLSMGANDKFQYRDIASILLCVATTDAPGYRTWFKNQTKGAINNSFIGNAFMKFTYNKFRYWLDNNTALATKILQEVIANKVAREEAAAVTGQVIKKLTGSVGFGNKPKDFRDCSSKIISERELYIVEGRSALGATKLACNAKFQAVIPVRGKIINCLKEKLTRILNNDIVIDLYRVLGCGIEAKSEYIDNLPKFDINKLNWGKIIICTDADIDGYHIRTLLMTMFYVLSPSLLKAGKIYIAETPLYEMTYKKETKFAFDDAEKAKYIEYFKSLGAKEGQIKIERSKGLGENDPEMMSVSTMKPETRRLIRVEYPEDDSDLRMYFNALLGDDIETRRELIEAYFDIIDNNAE